MWISLMLCSFLTAFFFYLNSKRPKNFPPGPAWWPVVGSLFEVLRLHKKWGTLSMATAALAKNYGNVQLFGLRICNDIQVIVTSAEAAMEMGSNPKFDGRPTGPFYTHRTWGLRRGIGLTDDEFWKEQRSFVVRHMRNFGLGKSSQTESIVMTEVQAFKDHLKEIISRSVDGKAVVAMSGVFSMSILNTIWVMLAGTRYDLDDVELRKLQNILTDMFASFDVLRCPFQQFPLLRYLMPEVSGYNKYIRSNQKLWSFLQEELLRHQASYVEGNARDFIDVYLAELKSRQNEKNSTFSGLQLMAICMDMFIGGSDTTSKTLSFAFLHFLRQPKVAQKVQQEIDQVVGRDRKVTLDDRPNLPYTRAAANEANRVFTSHSLGVPHRAMADSTLKGYFIPKDTTLVINYNSIYMNEEHYEEPWIFKPERYLLNDEKKNEGQIPDIGPLPFGVGNRRCIGDTLAKSNIFLFIANLLQTFNFENPPDCPLPDPFPIEGVTPSSQPYEAQISLRV